MAHLGSDAPLRLNSMHAVLGDLPAHLAALQGADTPPHPVFRTAVDLRLDALELRIAFLEAAQQRRWWQNVADVLRSWWARLRGA
jgi:hypothetical protein